MHSIYKQGNLPYLSVKMCPKCEQLLPLNVESCHNCCYNFTSKSMSQVQLREKKEEPVVAAKPTLVIQKAPVVTTEPEYQSKEIKDLEVPAEQPKKVEKCVYCDNCGAKIIGSQRYCGGCGAKVSKRICPSCDQIVDANLTFCPLCGERLKESSNVTPVETPVTNQVPVQPIQQPVQPIPQFYGQPQGYNGQPINIYLNQNSAQPLNSENAIPVEPTQDEVQLEEVPVELEEVNEPQEEVVKEFNGINMGRKRLFLIIQLLIVGVLAAIMIMVPVLTSDNFFKALIPCITGTSNESLVSGKNVIEYVLECISTQSILLNQNTDFYSSISIGGSAIFTSIPFIYKLLAFTGNADSFAIMISIIVVLFSYAIIALAMLVCLISGFVGLFVKRPYKGKALGFLLISLLIGCLFIYTSTFFEPFNNGGKPFDSWLVYAFALIFFVWFIVKLVFTKEAKMFKKAKEEAKLAKEIEEDEE